MVGIPEATYHYHIKNFIKEDPDRELKELITDLFKKFHERYGYKRITKELKKLGHCVNHKRVYRLMRIPKKPFIDTKVMKFLKQRHVPVGVFYRDVYWKFDELYPLKGAKKTVMKTIYRMEENFYSKYCDVIFLPSDAMGKYVDINREKVSLPPGGKESQVVRSERVKQNAQGLYVGGINNEDYGLFLLLDALF